MSEPGRPRRSLVLVLVAAATLLSAPGALAATPDWTKASPIAVVEGLEMPTDIDVAPNGDIWFTELAGKVSRHVAATGKVELMHEVDDVVTGGERGLVGLALAKDFGTTGTYFLYYTKRTDDPDGGLNHLVRVNKDGDETILVTVSGAKEHNGGRIVVDEDGNLFVGTGENQLQAPAQDVKSLLGKILHMTPEGKPVAGNMDGLVYAKGIRNPYGLAINPDDGELWETENSGWRRDEVNLIKAGGNYGYPECEGNNLNGLPGKPDEHPCPTTKGYTFPVRTFYETDAVAPTGMTFWRGELYWGSLNEGSIHHLWQDLETYEWRDVIVLRDQGFVLDLAVQGDDLLFSTMDSIKRISLPEEDVGNTGGSLPDSSVNPNVDSDATEKIDDGENGIGGLPFAAMVAAVAVGVLVRRKRSG